MDPKDIKALRLKKGWSQQVFGELLGFSKKWARMRVSEMERGARPVSARTAQLCQFLNGRKR